MKDGKMSKSVGNVIYPEDLIKKYGLDATRYYLLRTMQYATDSVFTPEDFIDRYNFDLCNDLGNLLNRTIGMINKYFNGYISKKYKVSNDVDIELEEFTTNTIDEFISQMDDLYVSNSLSSVWKIVSRTNKYIDETTPWILAKDESLEAKEKLKSVMYHLAENLRKIAILISPFMVDTSEKIFMQLGFDNQFFKTWNFVKTYLEFEVKVTEKGEPLFLRKDREEEIEYIKNLMK